MVLPDHEERHGEHDMSSGACLVYRNIVFPLAYEAVEDDAVLIGCLEVVIWYLRGANRLFLTLAYEAVEDMAANVETNWISKCHRHNIGDSYRDEDLKEEGRRKKERKKATVVVLAK